MKSVVLYYSFTNNNAKLADEIAKIMNTEVINVTDKKPRSYFTIIKELMFKTKPQTSPDHIIVKDYDYIVVVAPVWANKVATPMIGYLEEIKKLKIPYSFSSIHGYYKTEPSKVYKQLLKIAGEPQFYKTFSVKDLKQKDKSKKMVLKYRITNKQAKTMAESFAASEKSGKPQVQK